MASLSLTGVEVGVADVLVEVVVLVLVLVDEVLVVLCVVVVLCSVVLVHSVEEVVFRVLVVVGGVQ